MLWFVVFCFFLIPQTKSCPFYQNVPTNTTSTTNYTTLSSAMIAAMENNFCIVVCDKAFVFANETLPNITSSLCVTGDTPIGMVFPYLTVENNLTSPTFFINASNSDSVVFESINIINAGTLFSIVGESQLTLLNMRCYNGQVCVEVNSSTTRGLLQPGLYADTASFMANAIGILNINGWVNCKHCTFYDSLVSSVLTRNTSPNPWVYFEMYDQHYINSLYPIALQYAPGEPIAPPAGISSTYADSTNYFNCQTYATVNAFGAGEGCPPCAACPSCSSRNILQVLFGIGVWILVFACLFTCCRRNKTDKVKKSYQSA
jgi:hypothetical protein